MKLKVTKEGLEFSSLVKMVATGYAIIITILFFLVILLFAVTKSAEFPVYKMLPALLVIPIVAVAQGLLLGCAISVCLFIYKKKRAIEVVTNE